MSGLLTQQLLEIDAAQVERVLDFVLVGFLQHHAPVLVVSDVDNRVHESRRQFLRVYNE